MNRSCPLPSVWLAFLQACAPGIEGLHSARPSNAYSTSPGHTCIGVEPPCREHRDGDTVPLSRFQLHLRWAALHPRLVRLPAAGLSFLVEPPPSNHLALAAAFRPHRPTQPLLRGTLPRCPLQLPTLTLGPRVRRQTRSSQGRSSFGAFSRTSSTHSMRTTGALRKT